MRTNKLLFLLFFSFAVITVYSQDTLYQEDFENKTESLISITPQGWATETLSGGDSQNSWGFSNNDPITGNYSLTINDGSNYYSYNNSDNCDKVAFYNTLIDASGYYDLRISFSWKCDGQATFDYGMIKYSTDGTTWNNLSDEKFDSESTVHHVINLNISSLDNSSFYLGFEWINDDASGSDPPFTVDDIVLTGMGSVNSTNITYPTDGATEITQKPIIVWEKTHNALGYKLYFGTDNPPTNILNGETTKSTAYYVSSDLAANTKHYLKVVPYNSGYTASSCPIISFTTIDPTTYTEWTGATNSDWSNSGNWSNGVPDNSKNVLIPVVDPGANQPTVNATATVNNITIEKGGVINNSSYNLSVLGDWKDYFGTYNGSSGTVVFEGTSSNLSAYANSVYLIDGLSTNDSSITDITSDAGDYRGGIAVTKDYLYVTGDGNTVRMSASDLSGVTSMGVRRDGMFSDLLTGKLYTLFGNSNINGTNTDNTVPVCPCADNGSASDYSCVERFTITSLKEINEDINLSISSTTIPLIDENGNATTITCYGGQRTGWIYRTGIYPGYGFVCIFADNESGSECMYVIDIQSGTVKNMGLKNITPEMERSESWATWGFGEYDGKDYYLIYKMKDEDRLRRVNLTTMLITDYADFSYTQYGLGKMSCITFSPWLSRWYFEVDGPSEFNSGAASGVEIAGYASGSNVISVDAGQPEVLTNVQINKTNSTDKFTLNSPITVNNLTIANGDLDVGTDNRKITVKGNLDIQSTGNFTKQSGTVAFEGSNAQTISGNTDFYNFDINKTSGNLTLSSDLNVSNKLALDKGLIITGTNKVYFSNTVADSLTGGADDCFVYGNLKRAIASNTDTYSFPVGLGTTTTDYYKLDFINNNISGINDLTTYAKSITEVGNDVDANLVATESNGNPYTDLVEGAVWDITPDNNPTGGSYGVDLYFGNQSGNLTDNKFGVLKRPSGSTDYKDWDSFYATTTIPADGAAGRTVVSGYAQRTGFTGFSEYGIGTTPFSLPIELINFNAQCNNNIITLSWATASEINNDYFTVEKSFDAQNFKIFTTVAGAGNSNSILNYSVVDNSYENQEHRNIYYRLKQTDFDGRFTYSDIIKVSCSPDYNKNLNINNLLVDNANKRIKFSINTDSESKIKVRLIDVYGRVLFTISKKLYSGINTVSFNNSNLTSGIYFLEINDNENIITKKIVLN